MAKRSGSGGVRSLLGKEKFKHGTAAVVFTAVFIAIVIAVNVIVSVLTTRFPSMNIDLTNEGLNSLSEDALNVAKGIERDTTIYLVGTEEKYREDQLYTNYNLKFSQVANLADRLQEVNGHIHVEFVDPDLNPQFISKYADDSLTSGKVVVESDLRHKTLDVNDLFAMKSNSQTGAYEYYSQVDGALANALYLVNLDNVPIVAIATGHSELLSASSGYLDSFTGLLEDNNFAVETFDLLTEEIPADAQMIFFGAPTTDFTSEEIDKLAAYLDDETMTASRTLYFACNPTQDWEHMTNLSTFLEEWGLAAETNVVVESDAANILSTYTGDPRYIFTHINETENENIITTTYDNLIMPNCAPITRLFTGNSSISTCSVVETSGSAYVLTSEMMESGELPEDPETGTETVVALAQRYMDNYGNVRAGVVLNGSAMSLMPNYLGNSTFGNAAFTTDLIKLLAGVNDTRVGLSIKQTQINTLDINASAQVINIVGVVFAVVLPVAVFIVGLVIFLKRRHL